MSFLEQIKSPPAEYSSAAFWFWYGTLEPEKLRKQIDMMVEKGVYQGFMHARAYLETEYLGEDWWKAVSACIDEGEKVGFYPWLYDEYAWPSGTAGSTFKHGTQPWSRTLSGGEKNMSKFLVIKNYACGKDAAEDIEKGEKYRSFLTAFCKKCEKWEQLENVSEADGSVMAFFCQASPRFVDYLNEDTIKEFIGYTHEEYKKRFGEHFGKRVPGIFFDEIFMLNQKPWTDRFANEFEKRMGYDIMPVLYALTEPEGEKECKIRNDYYKVASQLYEESFFKQISEWCSKNDLLLTGHIEEFFVVHPGRQGQFFNNMRHTDIPGADCHDYRYRFPRRITYREPKFAVSTARAYGKKRMMSEAFGGAGWGCSLQEFKRGVNTLGAMGINMITLHGFYSQCDNQGMQGDWPTSFFFQNPYWRYFKDFADYMNRVCFVNSQGTPVVEVGLYYPIEEMQIETVSGVPTEKAFALDKAWNDAMNNLIENQIDVDIIDEPCILCADVADGTLSVGSQSFKVLLLPDMVRKSKALDEKLCEFTNVGGKILYYACTQEANEGVINPEDLPCALEKVLQTDVKVIKGEKDNFYINHRVIENKDVYFVANGRDEARTLTLSLRACGGVYKISPEDAQRYDVTCRIADTRTEVELSFEPDEAFWLVVDKNMPCKTADEGMVVQDITVPGVWEFLPLDKSIEGEKQLDVDSTALEIPLAVFSSELHPGGKQIRIQNTEHEKGRVGRHLSLWNGAWITRRPDWIDNAQKTQLFFRRKISLDNTPSSAKLCIAAVNRWTLFVNGKKAAFSDVARQSSVVDICDYLVKGENLIAIKVENDTPMEHFNLLSTDKLLPEEMISLLAEGEICAGGKTIVLCSDSKWGVCDKEENGWNELGFENKVYKARSVDALITCGESDNWFWAWERGKPPILPWGDIKLFDKTVSYPQRVCYTVTLPAGTDKIIYPEISGSDVCITVDGMKRTWDDGVCYLVPDGISHTMQIAVTAQNENDGLLSNIKVFVSAFETTLCDWRLHGLKWYSGFARYKNKVNISKDKGRYVLKLLNTAFHAEVWINGKCAGHRVWQPYELDITEFVKDGENEIVVIASNSEAVERQFMLVDEGEALGWNRYWNYDNIQREGENLASGLMGPVRIARVIK